MPIELAKRFRAIILGSSWIANTSLKEQVDGLDWYIATTKLSSLNTIAALTFHLHYYIAGLIHAFEHNELTIKDTLSFNLPLIREAEDWNKLLNQLWIDAEKFACIIESMTEEQLNQDFVVSKYGTVRQNIEGLIEHNYYHIGQIVILKKLIKEPNDQQNNHKNKIQKP